MSKNKEDQNKKMGSNASQLKENNVSEIISVVNMEKAQIQNYSENGQIIQQNQHDLECTKKFQPEKKQHISENSNKTNVNKQINGIEQNDLKCTIMLYTPLF